MLIEGLVGTIGVDCNGFSVVDVGKRRQATLSLYNQFIAIKTDIKWLTKRPHQAK